MARKCEICGKKPQSGHNVSHAKNRTKRRFLPNLRKVKIQIGGTEKTMIICARCLKMAKMVPQES